MTNKKGTLKAMVLLACFLTVLAVVVIVLQYRQVEYIFSGESVVATVENVNNNNSKSKYTVSYVDRDGETVEASAVLKSDDVKAGDKVNVVVIKRVPEKVYEIPSRHMMLMFDIAFLLFEFIGWLGVVKLLRKLKKYKKLSKKGKKATATVTSVKNTSGILGADISFEDSEGTARSTVYYPDSDIPQVGDKLDIVYYIKKTGKIVFMVPKDE